MLCYCSMIRRRGGQQLNKEHHQPHRSEEHTTDHLRLKAPIFPKVVSAYAETLQIVAWSVDQYSFVHDQLPPLWQKFILLQYAGSLDCHQLYIVIVANACGCTQGLFWLSGRTILKINVRDSSLSTC